MKLILGQRRRSLKDVLPVFMVDNRFGLLNSGRVMMGYAVDGTEIEKLSASEQGKLSQALASSWDNLPANTIIEKRDVYYHSFYQEKNLVDGFFTRKDRDLLHNRPVLQHDSSLYISLGASKERQPDARTTQFSRGTGLGRNPLANIDQQIAKLEMIGSDTAHTLAGHGITLQRLDDDQLWKQQLAYLNMQFDPENQPDNFHHQLTPYIHGMAVGAKQVRVISMIGQGELVKPTSRDKGINQPLLYPLTLPLDCPHLVVTSIRIEDQEKKLKELDSRKRFVKSLGILSNQETRLHEAEIEEFTYAVRESNASLVSVNVSVIVWDIDTKRLHQAVEKTVGAFRKRGCQCLVENMDTANLYFASAPGNSFQNYRRLLMTGEQASSYLHFSTKYESDVEGIRLSDRYGNPLLVNLFNTDLSNQNAIVIGLSGSGKSFFVQNLIIQRHEAE